MTNTLDCTEANNEKELRDIIDANIIAGDLSSYPEEILVNKYMHRQIRKMFKSKLLIPESLTFRGIKVKVKE